MIPDLSVVWVIGFVLLLAGLLDRLLFRPLLGVVARREEAIRSARELATTAAQQAQAAAAEFETRTSAARGGVYRQMEDRRKAALGRRGELLARAREDAEDAIHEATTRLKAEADEARARLERDADALGAAVAERVLGRKVS